MKSNSFLQVLPCRASTCRIHSLLNLLTKCGLNKKNRCVGVLPLSIIHRSLPRYCYINLSENDVQWARRGGRAQESSNENLLQRVCIHISLISLLFKLPFTSARLTSLARRSLSPLRNSVLSVDQHAQGSLTCLRTPTCTFCKMSVSKLALLGRACIATTISMAGGMPAATLSPCALFAEWNFP